MRYYSSIAAEGALTAAINSSATTIAVSTTTGWPVSTPFTLALGAGQADEELVTVTAVAGTTATVTRGEDGTAAIPHDMGAPVRHMSSGRDFREPQEHIAASTNVHGLGSGVSVVGTSSTQTLTNKTISGASNTLTDVPQSAVTNLTTDLATLQTNIDNVGTSLATVATTGSYNDLADQPTVTTLGAVPTSRTINTKPLSANVTLAASDVGAVPTTRTVNGNALSANVTLSASDVGAVPTTRTVNGKALSSNISLTASDVGAASSSHTHTKSQISDLPAITGSATAGTIPQRDGSGFLSGNTPTSATHLSNKYYVDLQASQASANGVNAAAYARTVGSSYYAMYMGGDYLIGRNVSSRRYKDNIAPAVVNTDAVLALEPVTFHRKTEDDPNVRDLGLIAEDSTGVDHLVVYENGVPEAVRYETVLPVALLAVVKEQQKQIDELTARVATLEGK